MARLAQGDTEAFSEVYRLYYNRLLRYGIIIHRDTEVVADVIQDLFVWLLRNPTTVSNINTFEVYLFSSLKRNLLRYLADHTHSGRLTPSESRSQSDLSIEDRIIQRETQDRKRELLNRKLDDLPSKQKEVIYLRYYEGLSYDEIADILSTTNQVVRNYASRALAQLRRSLGSS